ncbi:MAG: L,D-transpeptidase [Actinobacteria bacterium]|nr:MAG: L,D-transpeptidase [Actinomycetota bacterium]
MSRIGPLGALLAAALALPSAGHAVDSRVIGSGVSVAGVDVSGLTVDAAAARLQEQLGPRLLHSPVVIGAAGHVFRLRPGRARARFDAAATARRAYAAGTGTPATGTGGAPISVTPALRFSVPALKTYAAQVARRVDRAPRSAHVHIGLTHIAVRRERWGRHLDQRTLIRATGNALKHVDPGGRVLHVKALRDRPRVGARRLPHLYATVVTVDRDHFRLRLFKHLRFYRGYPIAVGRAGLATPAGLYHVEEKEVDPAWHVPNSSWAGSLAGQTIPGGAANNPLKARWLGLGGGVGIHGTAEDWSIGSRASHGCIRMHVSDVIELYRHVPLGTPVLIR